MRSSSTFLARVAALAARRPRTVLLLVTALAAAGAAYAALTLSPSTGTDTLLGRDSPTYRATERLQRTFGGEAVEVLVREKLSQLVLSSDLQRLAGLEGCLSGNVPKGRKPAGGARSPCAYFARRKPLRAVYGPGTFLNEATLKVQDAIAAELRGAGRRERRAGDAARKRALADGATAEQARQAAAQAQRLAAGKSYTRLLSLASRYGIDVEQGGLTNNQQFISAIVFDQTRGAGQPKARFSFLFPSDRAALIQARLRPGLSQAGKDRAIDAIRAAVAMPRWKLIHGGSYVVSGAPVVISGLAPAVTHSLLVLLAVALVVMALVLAFAFRARRRLLPLAIALLASALTFGVMALAGIALTMASIAVLPVLIGLAVDYAIQFQSRVGEERSVARGAHAGAGAIATAALATLAGFLVLLLSPVPMVRGFGLVLVIGIALAFACALVAGSAALALGRGGSGGGATSGRAGALAAAGRGALELAAVGARPFAWLARRLARPFALVARAAAAALAASWRGAGELLGAPARALARAGGRAGAGALRTATARPGRVLAIGLVLAAAGWALDTRTTVVSDIEKLVPRDLPALGDLNTLERATGVSGEIDVLVSSPHLTSPKVVRWMNGYTQRTLAHHGYSEARGCARAELCPGFSLSDLLGSASGAKSIDALLKAIPPYFSKAVISRDRHSAVLSFGIRLMPLAKQQRVIDSMRSTLHPPAGVHAQLAGLPVIAAQANADVSSTWRRILYGIIAPLALVALVLLAALRSRRRALVPLVPIVLATGWSGLLLFAVRIPLNPMSVTLGALVVAISTEFSVLLSERYHQERGGRDGRSGLEPAAALRRAYRSTGRAVAASGITAIAGFAVLAASDIRMLRDFGIVTVVDLGVSLLGVLAVLPAVLMLAERGGLSELGARARRRARRGTGAGRLPRLRRARATRMS